LLLCYSVDRQPTTARSTLSLHDALPICPPLGAHGGTVRGAPPSKITRERPRGANHTSVTWVSPVTAGSRMLRRPRPAVTGPVGRSEEHTSELQSRFDLVCRLLLEKKKNI